MFVPMRSSRSGNVIPARNCSTPLYKGEPVRRHRRDCNAEPSRLPCPLEPGVVGGGGGVGGCMMIMPEGEKGN